MLTTTSQLIPLKHGFVVPDVVLLWLLDAEGRGLRFFALEDDILRVRPKSSITAADDAFLREHKPLLLACVRYCDEMAQEHRDFPAMPTMSAHTIGGASLTRAPKLTRSRTPRRTRAIDRVNAEVSRASHLTANQGGGLEVAHV